MTIEEPNKEEQKAEGMKSEGRKAEDRKADGRKSAGAKPKAKEKEPLSLTEVIKEQATEDEAPFARQFSLRKILGGDILNTRFIRRQVWLFLLIGLFMVIYIANRYSCQKDIILIDQLQNELKDAKYKALSSNSQYTEASRETNVLEQLKNRKDSTLKMPSQPPYLIMVPEEK
ncbi:MAG: FtsL-like putative cell division protein [Prevotella sp.]|jgi:hypothetical protein|nr:FtsL-like putative cell division protein [Prevotella sp.]